MCHLRIRKKKSPVTLSPFLLWGVCRSEWWIPKDLAPYQRAWSVEMGKPWQVKTSAFQACFPTHNWFLRNGLTGRNKKPQADGWKMFSVRKNGYSLCVPWDSVYATTLVSFKFNRLHGSNKTSDHLFYLYPGNQCRRVKSAFTKHPELCNKPVSTSSSSSVQCSKKYCSLCE